MTGRVLLRLHDGDRVKVRLQLEPRDAWVGLFWRTRRALTDDGGFDIKILHLYLCVLPFLPVHVTVLVRAWRVSMDVDDDHPTLRNALRRARLPRGAR